jgi:hypothetical protein
LPQLKLKLTLKKFVPLPLKLLCLAVSLLKFLIAKPLLAQKPLHVLPLTLL